MKTLEKFVNIEYMLNSMALAHLCCEDIANIDLYDYLMSGEI